MSVKEVVMDQLNKSACSFAISALKSLFISTICIGSTNKVEPEADWSCTSPGIVPLQSLLSGITYLSERIVTMLSCKYLEYCGEVINC